VSLLPLSRLHQDKGLAGQLARCGVLIHEILDRLRVHHETVRHRSDKYRPGRKDGCEFYAESSEVDGLHAPRPCSDLALALCALIDEVSIGGGQILPGVDADVDRRDHEMRAMVAAFRKHVFEQGWRLEC